MNRTHAWHESTLFALLQDADRAALLELGQPRRFRSGERLIAQGDPPDSVLLLTYGSAKVTLEPDDRPDTLLELRLAGDLVGELTALEGHERVASARAFGPVQARVIDSMRLRRFLEANPRVTMALLDVHSRRWRWSFNRRADFSLYDARTRVLRVLDQVIPECVQPRPGSPELEVPLGQEELAQLAGTGKRTTQSALKELHELGVLRQGYRRVYITDQHKLHHLATHPGQTPSAPERIA